jgi:hypothetical protein
MVKNSQQFGKKNAMKASFLFESNDNKTSINMYKSANNHEDELINDDGFE